MQTTFYKVDSNNYKKIRLYNNKQNGDYICTSKTKPVGKLYIKSIEIKSNSKIVEYTAIPVGIGDQLHVVNGVDCNFSLTAIAQHSEITDKPFYLNVKKAINKSDINGHVTLKSIFAIRLIKNKCKDRKNFKNKNPSKKTKISPVAKKVEINNKQQLYAKRSRKISLEEIMSFSKQDLKDSLRDLGLKLSSNKSVLVERLIKYVSKPQMALKDDPPTQEINYTQTEITYNLLNNKPKKDLRVGDLHFIQWKHLAAFVKIIKLKPLKYRWPNTGRFVGKSRIGTL